MQLIEGLMTRSSIGQLVAPAPSNTEINVALNAAMRAPDHGRMKPWRFHLIQGVAREKLGQHFANETEQTAQADGRSFTEKQKEKCLAMPLRAPLIVAVSALLKMHKIPKIEQSLAVGAAVQNMQLAFHALGYGSIWRTGDMAHSSFIKRVFGLAESDELIAFLYVGKSGLTASMGQESASQKSPSAVVPVYPESYAQLSPEDQQCVFHWLGN